MEEIINEEYEIFLEDMNRGMIMKMNTHTMKLLKQ